MKRLWFLLFALSCGPPPQSKGSMRLLVTFPPETSIAQRDSIHKANGCKLESRNEETDIVRVKSPIFQPTFKKYLRCDKILFFEPIPQ